MPTLKVASKGEIHARPSRCNTRLASLARQHSFCNTGSDQRRTNLDLFPLYILGVIPFSCLALWPVTEFPKEIPTLRCP